MFIVSNLLMAVANIIDMALNLYMILILARALISWVSPDPRNPIVHFLQVTTEPALMPVRRLIYRHVGMTGIDISPIVVIFAIVFVRQFLVLTLRQFAQML